jgi:hypothetical protein
MTEIRMKPKDIEEIRKRLDLLLKDFEKYRLRYGVFVDEKETLRLCRMLVGIGIRNSRARVPKPLKALKGRGLIRVVRGKAYPA